MPQVVPVQIDLRELIAIDPSARPGTRRLDAMRQQHERFARRSNRALVFAGGSAESLAVGAKESAPL